MKKILAIISSPRKLGNSEIMVKEISRNITQPHELQLLRLSDFNIKPCIGCYMCLIKNKGCVLKDDFNMIAENILDANALIVAAPTYFLGANSCLKRFSDRGLALYPHAEKLWGKPAVGVGIAGIPGKEGYTLLGIESFIKLVLADMKQVRLIYGALPGEIFLNNKNRDTAKDMASALFEPAPEKDKSSCSLCGGKTFRFFDNNKVRCMLCSNTGAVTLQDNIPVFDMQKSDHELFLSLEEVIEHRNWLVSMKSRFLKHKDELKKISLDYRKDGGWIKP